MKRKAGIIILICSLLALVGFLTLSNGSKTLNQLWVDQNAYNEIKSSRTPMGIKNVDLRMNGINCVYSPSTGTFYYSLKEGSSTSKDPSVTLKADMKAVKLAFMGEGISEESLRSAAEIPFLAYTDTGYCEYKLTCTTLPILCIDAEAGISDTESKMQMTLYDNRKEATSTIIKSEGDVRIRGAMSRYFAKTGLKLSLTKRSVGNNKRTNDISLLGMRRDDDWILYALYNDQEKVRSVFCQNLWYESCGADNASGKNISSEFKFVEVFVNGEYYGLCGLGTPTDEMSYGYSGDTEKEALYMATGWGNLTDNFMLVSGAMNGYELKSGESVHTDNHIDNYDWDLFLEYLYQFEENKYNNEELLKGIDIDNALDFYLYINLIQGQDTTYGQKIRNYYFGLTREEDESINILYDAWDMDISWGNKWDGNFDHNATATYEITPEMNYLTEAGYVDQLMRNHSEYLKEAMMTKYRELRAGAWSEEAILQMLDEYENQIYGSGAYIRECNRWPESTRQDPNLGLDLFKEYVLRRLEENDLYMERLYAVYDSPILIRKVSAYKHFYDSPVLMVFNNSNMLFDSDFQDLFENMGIDTGKIDSSVKAILYDGSKNEYEFLYEFGGNGFEYSSDIGTIAILRKDFEDYYSDDDGSVFFNGAYCYDTIGDEEPAVRFYHVYDDKAVEVNYYKDDNFNFYWFTLDDFVLYVKALRMMNGDVVVTSSNLDFLKDKRVKAALDLIEDRVTYVEGGDGTVLIEVTDSESGERIDKVEFTYKLVEKGNGKRVKTKTATHYFD